MKQWHEIDGWFDWHSIYDEFVDKCPSGGQIVEIGVYLGKSLAYLADKARFKDIQIFGVDVFQFKDYLEGSSFYDQTLANLHGYTNVHLMPTYSVHAAQLFNRVHAVFIDGDHSYMSVRADIKAWLPKCKYAIAGHDYCNPLALGIKRAVDELLPEREVVQEASSWIYRIGT